MLQNARVTTFTISELLRENQQGGDNSGVESLQVQVIPLIQFC